MATPKVPDYIKFGMFNPQKNLATAFPDFMRQVGYESTGGYPIEQAPWMAGPPVPDFMTLGGLSGSFVGPGSNGPYNERLRINDPQSIKWRTATIQKNQKTGMYWLNNALGQAEFYSIPSSYRGLGYLAGIENAVKEAESKTVYDISERAVAVKNKEGAGALLKLAYEQRNKVAVLPAWDDRKIQGSYFSSAWWWTKDQIITEYARITQDLEQRFGPFDRVEIEQSTAPVPPPQKSFIGKLTEDKEEAARRQAEEEAYKAKVRAKVEDLINKGEALFKQKLYDAATEMLNKAKSYNLPEYRQIINENLRQTGAAFDAGQQESMEIILQSQASDAEKASRLEQLSKLANSKAAAAAAEIEQQEMIKKAAMIGGGVLLLGAVGYFVKKRRG